MIDILSVSKTFVGKGEDIKAVDNVTLHIDTNEIFGIIGLSGAGKSTLIRCINLLERPTKGSVLIDGNAITTLSEQQLRTARKKIGMIFQHFNLMPSRTVYQNIEFPLRGQGLNAQDKRQRIIALIELVGLSDKENAYPSQLSGGQKQRVAIARALANHPNVLLCDEATSALDPQTTQSILKLLKDLNRKLGLTIVLITHEMSVIKEICRRVAIMENGRVIEQGSIFEIFSSPRTNTARDFVNTTSNLNKIYDLIENDLEALKLKKGDVLAKISYAGINTMEALVSTVSRQYSIDVNIIFGDVEFIQNTPLGGIIAVLSGDTLSIKNAIRYLSEKNIIVEVIRNESAT